MAAAIGRVDREVARAQRLEGSAVRPAQPAHAMQRADRHRLPIGGHDLQQRLLEVGIALELPREGAGIALGVVAPGVGEKRQGGRLQIRSITQDLVSHAGSVTSARLACL